MAMSIIDLVRRLVGDEDALAQFAADPQGTLDDAGLLDVTAADLHDVLTLLNDSGEEGDGHFAAPQPVHHTGGNAESPASFILAYVRNNGSASSPGGG